MAGERERHIFLSGTEAAVDYTYSRGTPRGGDIPPRDPQAHRDRLAEEWAAIWAKKREEDEDRKAVHKTTRQGVYIQFEILPGFDVEKPGESYARNQVAQCYRASLARPNAELQNHRNDLLSSRERKRVPKEAG